MKLILCELTGAFPPTARENTKDHQQRSDQNPTSHNECFASIFGNSKIDRVNVNNSSKSCPCKLSADAPGNTKSMFVFDDKTIKAILDRFESKELATTTKQTLGYRDRSKKTGFKAEEPCLRPGCVHWKPPPPCLWDLPCKADCFETPPGIQPGRNPWGSGVGGSSIPDNKAVNLNYGITRTTSKFARKSSSCAKKGDGDKKKDDEGSSENVASGDCNSESIYDCRKYGHNLPSNNVMTCFEPLYGIPSGVFRNTFGECLGPGADKCGCYKNPEYFSFHHMTFFDIHMYLRCCRNPCPVTGRKP